jgi:hypothetical protein
VARVAVGTLPAEDTATVNPARVARNAPPIRSPRALIILASNRRSRTDRTETYCG